MNVQEEFYQVMTRLKPNSRAASTQVSKDDARVTEMINGFLISKAAKKEPEVIDLQEYAKSRKAGSVSNQDINVNKVRANSQLHKFKWKNLRKIKITCYKSIYFY
jgi:hypothetical protein